MKNMSTGALISIVLVTFIVFNGLLAGLLILNSMNAPEPRQYTDEEIRAAFALATTEPTASPTPSPSPEPTPIPTPEPLSLDKLIVRNSIAALPENPKLLKLKPAAFVSAFNKAAKKAGVEYLLDSPEKPDDNYLIYSITDSVSLLICSVDSKIYQATLLSTEEGALTAESPAYICADLMMAALNSKLAAEERAKLLEKLRVSELPVDQDIIKADVATGGVRYDYARSHTDGIRFAAYYNTEEK